MYRHLFWRWYAALVVLVVTMAVCCAAFATDLVSMSNSVKLLRFLHAQDEPKLVFRPGLRCEPRYRPAYSSSPDLMHGQARRSQLLFIIMPDDKLRYCLAGQTCWHAVTTGLSASKTSAFAFSVV